MFPLFAKPCVMKIVGLWSSNDDPSSEISGQSTTKNLFGDDLKTFIVTPDKLITLWYIDTLLENI